MPVVSVEVRSPLSPEEVLRVITDFSERRAEAWPGVDRARLVVHDLGAGFADVTEGNSTTWERVRYEWDARPGPSPPGPLDSNVWAEGSRWDYRITSVDRRHPGRGPARAARQEPQGQAHRRAAAGGGREGRHRQPASALKLA